MILGRNAAVWIGLVAAVLNMCVLVFGINLDGPQLASLNAAAACLIGLVANSNDPTTVPTFALTTKAEPDPKVPSAKP